jgi:hypothetical protein
MGQSEEIKASQVRNASDAHLVFPDGFSFFQPYLEYWIKETLEIGGEASCPKPKLEMAWACSCTTTMKSLRTSWASILESCFIKFYYSIRGLLMYP